MNKIQEIKKRFLEDEDFSLDELVTWYESEYEVGLFGDILDKIPDEDLEDLYEQRYS